MTTDFKSLLTDLTQSDKLSKFNRLELLCRPPTDMPYVDLLLQLKTYFMVDKPIEISHYYNVIDTASGVIKPYKKECYASGDDVPGTHCLSYASQGKSNLFGWHPPEDSTHYDTYVSQPMQKKYRYAIQSIHDLGNGQHCVASSWDAVEDYVNMTHGAVMTESFMEYAVQVAAYCQVAIREYYTPGLATHAVILATCTFDEESHVIPAKLECFHRVYRFLKGISTPQLAC